MEEAEVIVVDVEAPERPERPGLRVLRYVNPQQFSPEHAKLLKRLEAYSWDGTTAGQLARRLAVGDLWLFEAVDPGAVFLLSTSELGPNIAGQLNIEGIAGDGVIARADDIAADLRTIAQHYGAERLAAVTPRDGWGPLGDKLGFTPMATIWHMEVANGRVPEEHHDDAEG